MSTAILRPELPALPETMKALPVFRGYPVPWFVAWVNGEPEFRAMDAMKFRRAVQEGLCWVCGEPFTNRRRVFVIGPMCAVNRVSAEPPCHFSCAEFSAKGCPFLSRPQMVRRGHDDLEGVTVQDGHLAHNPGVTLVWQTRVFDVFTDSKGHPLVEFGDPDNWWWYKEGRSATREEILASIDIGKDKLLEAAREDGMEMEAEEKIKWVIDHLVPRS